MLSPEGPVGIGCCTDRLSPINACIPDVASVLTSDLVRVLRCLKPDAFAFLQAMHFTLGYACAFPPHRSGKPFILNLLDKYWKVVFPFRQAKFAPQKRVAQGLNAEFIHRFAFLQWTSANKPIIGCDSALQH